MDSQNKSTPAEPQFELPAAANTPGAAVAARPKRSRGFLVGIIVFLLFLSVMLNFFLFGSQLQSLIGGAGENETYFSGDRFATSKLAIINVSGVIMPPYTERTLKAIKRAAEDDNVKGVLLVVDSPGGLVADSHQIYHRLQELLAPKDPKLKPKPIYVAMQRMAASGGYYIAMGSGKAGKIYAEPTTWTGSIGVIIPRYNFTKLAEKLDVKVEPLTTGPFKDALSPFRDLSDAERAVWKGILDDAFDRFVGVIADNRPKLDKDAVKKLATGQVYTADQALANGLVDKIGYVDDALADMKADLKLDKVCVVTLSEKPSFLEQILAGGQVKEPQRTWEALLESTVPQGMYLCSWGLGAPGWGAQ